MKKYLLNIVINRLKSFYESQLFKTKFGFHSSNDVIYITKQLQEIPYLSIKKAYTCYVDN